MVCARGCEAQASLFVRRVFVACELTLCDQFVTASNLISFSFTVSAHALHASASARASTANPNPLPLGVTREQMLRKRRTDSCCSSSKRQHL